MGASNPLDVEASSSPPRLVRRILFLDAADRVTWAGPDGTESDRAGDRPSEPLERSLEGDLRGLRSALARVRASGAPARSGGLRWHRGTESELPTLTAEVVPGPDRGAVVRLAPTYEDTDRSVHSTAAPGEPSLPNDARSVLATPSAAPSGSELHRGVESRRTGPLSAGLSLAPVAPDPVERKGAVPPSLRTERLASLGQLAAGVAHELNTPLANILLIAESIQRKAPDPWVAARASSIAQQVDAAAKIVAGLLEFGRDHPAVVREEALDRLVDEAVAFVGGKRSVDVRVELVHESPRLIASVNRVQVVQVVVNLVNNAYDAMEDRGRLRVRTRRDGDWAEIEVQDTGPGILPEMVPHLFEPFYTTKPEGKGTGLGLSICHGIVHAHGGSITVRSSPGEGAAFVVRLPVAPGRPPFPATGAGV